MSRRHLPALGGAAGWLNTEPLGPAELRGHVVLVNFWTLTCINWLRQEPYVRAWSRAYRDDGLVVVGVHTPEFSFEREIDRVRLATKERDIDYPVAVDSDYAIWSDFDNHYWPALYFVDAAGAIRDQHFGEGHYEQSERTIQRLLGVNRDLVAVDGVGAEAAADWNHLRTPETYLGYARSEQFASPERDAAGHVYQLPDRLRGNQWALAGEWTIGPENVVLDRAGGSIAYRFHARDAHLVLSTGAQEPIPYRVLVDGAPPGASHGVDVDENGNGVLTTGASTNSSGRPARSATAPCRSPSATQAPRRTRSPSDSPETAASVAPLRDPRPDGGHQTDHGAAHAACVAQPGRRSTP